MKVLAEKLRIAIHQLGTVAMMFECSGNALEALEKVKEGDYIISITKPTNKRSLQQNRYLWELIGHICTEENGSRADDVEIYCQLVEQAGVKCEYLLALPQAEERLRRVFRVVKIVDDREYNGQMMYVFKCFYGSSKMDTKEMSMLIDKTIERAEADGIDTNVWRRLLYEND